MQQKEEQEKRYSLVKSFNDHPNCKGHANAVLDDTFERKEERELLSNILDNYMERPTDLIN